MPTLWELPTRSSSSWRRKPAADAPPAPLNMDDDDDEECRGDVSFEDVAFTYPARPETEVLRGVSFRAAPGEVVALVGPSGSGKSSALALLQNFYAPSRGAVLLDGRPVTARSHAWLHRRHGDGRPLRARQCSSPTVDFAEQNRRVPAGGESLPSDEKGRTEVPAGARAANAVSVKSSMSCPKRRRRRSASGELSRRLSGGQKQGV